MKFLKLKFESAKLIREKNKTNLLGSNRFFHPITSMHIYNSLCVLLDRTPKPQLRPTDDKYLPFFSDIMDVVNEGFIKIHLINDNNKTTTIKKGWNSNAVSASQYTWVDCKYVLGNLQPIFIHYVSDILCLSKDEVTTIAFDDIIEKIQNQSEKVNSIKENKKGETRDIVLYTYKNEKITNLIQWLKTNSATIIANYIENKNESDRPTGFGKRVNRGIVDTHIYSGLIYIPLTQELHDELICHSKGYSNILDGGLVRPISYDFVMEDELVDFIEIKTLNSVRKFNEDTTNIVWENTIYKEIDEKALKESVDKIINQCGVSIVDNQLEYDKMLKKVLSVKFNGSNHKDIAYKINTFIEDSINKKYK